MRVIILYQGALFPLYENSFKNDENEMIVDTPFTLEETICVIKSLKCKWVWSSGGRTPKVWR